MFDIGDRVVCTGGNYDGNSAIYEGVTGTVCFVPDDSDRVGVRFDADIKGHSCDGKCPYGYGWYVDYDTIKLQSECRELEVDESALSEFISSIFCSV